SYEKPHLVATAQYLSATDNPFVAVDVKRRGLSFFGEGRQGPTGWAAVGGVDYITPDVSDPNSKQRRYVFGGARLRPVGRGRRCTVVTLESIFLTTTDQLQSRRLLAQTHVEF